MAEKNYIWKGAHSSIDVWSDGPDPQLIFSGPVAPGQLIDTPLDPTNEFVASLLTFKLLEEAPPEATADPAPLLIETLASDAPQPDEIAPTTELDIAQTPMEFGRRSRNKEPSND